MTSVLRFWIAGNGSVELNGEPRSMQGAGHQEARQVHCLLAETNPDTPRVRRIAFSDIRSALDDGLADFRAFPSHAVFLCLIYPIVGIFLGAGAQLLRDTAALSAGGEICTDR